MRKIFIGLLLAATAATPALADKGGKGGGPKGGKHAAAAHQGGGGGGKHAFRGGGERGPKAYRVDRGGAERIAVARREFRQDRGREWRQARFDQPVRFVRSDAKQERKIWKRVAKEERRFAKDERRFAREVSREPRVRFVERWAAPAPRYYDRPVYYEPARYVATFAPLAYSANTWSSYAGPRYDDGWSDDDGWYGRPAPLSYGYHNDPNWANDASGYWPSSYGYSPVSGLGGLGSGLFGNSGGGLLGALLPVVLQSLLGGSGGGLGLTGLGSGYDVLPLEQASYADPYAYDGGDLGSLLLPAALGSGGLF